MAELLENSELEVENIDDIELAKYVAVVVNKEEIKEKGLENIIPIKNVELEENNIKKKQDNYSFP